MNINREIDYESANAKLQDVLFKVEKEPVYVELIPIESTLFNHSTPEKILINEYNAIVNKSNNDILSVVSRNYNLITNQKALELGKEAFTKLFNVNADMKVYKVITSSRKTFCHIDLIHENVNLKVWEQDAWFPFIRVTNSYNRTYALAFELGFVRKLCLNGVIFNKKTIKVKYSHTGNIDLFQINADISQLESAKADFINHMLNLKRFYINESLYFPLLCKVLDIKKPIKNENDFSYEPRQKMYNDLNAQTISLTSEYIKQEGSNAYAFFNVITDLVSHQDEYKSIAGFNLNPTKYFLKPAIWVEEFVEKAEKRDFKIEEYINVL
ncbi:MAG: DUF932 domain-containing protein [Chitinophagaceae bacterium]|nr:DUF932 domain-containing protein [Chitinophagaceae bacterium]